MNAEDDTDRALARGVTVSFYRRAHLPILLASGLFDQGRSSSVAAWPG
jgi:hypothetical protein